MADGNKAFAYLGVLMGAVFLFIGLGALMYPDNSLFVGLSPQLKKIFTFILLLYGAFRIYRSLFIILRK